MVSPTASPKRRRSQSAISSPTPLLFKILKYNSLINVVGFALSYKLSVLQHGLLPRRLQNKSGPFNWWSVAAIAILAPGSFLLSTALSPMQLTQPSNVAIRKWKKLILLLVTKGTNRNTVLHSVSEMRHLCQIDPRIQFVVLTEEDRDFDAASLGVDVVFIPHAYQAPRAKYKARALEYFRVNASLDDDDWVLHLDEETLADDHCIQSCIDFIERSLYEYGQGVLVYNTRNYWQNWLLTFSEILRFRENNQRYQFQHGVLHRNFFGCLGSFLLCSGRIENAVTWDSDCLTEDFWFANEACKLGAGAGFVPAICREQSSTTVMDLLRQRKRWFRGMTQVPGPWGKLATLSWLISTFETPLALATSVGPVRLPNWLIVWMRVYFASSAFSVSFATLCSDLDARIPGWRIAKHLVLAPFASFAAHTLNATAVIYSLLTPVRGFHVIAKA